MLPSRSWLSVKANRTSKFITLNFRSVVDITITILLLTVHFVGYSSQSVFPQTKQSIIIVNTACVLLFCNKINNN